MRAKDEAIGILSERAARPGDYRIYYSELCNLIETIPFEPHNPIFWAFLGEISQEEYRAGRGMLTAIVVLKDSESKPGTGFIECAKELGLDARNPDRLWLEQLERVRDHWAGANA